MQFLSAWVPVPELSLWCSTELVPILCNTFLYWAEKNCMWQCRCSVDAELFEWEEESYLCWVGWIPCNKSPGCHWPSALQGHILNSYSACLPALVGFRVFSKNLSNQLTPICVLVQGLIWSLVHLPVLNFEFAVQLSIWIAVLPSSVLTTLPNITLSTNFLSVLCFRLLMKVWNSLALSTTTCGHL